MHEVNFKLRISPKIQSQKKKIYIYGVPSISNTLLLLASLLLLCDCDFPVMSAVAGLLSVAKLVRDTPFAFASSAVDPAVTNVIAAVGIP